MTRPTERGLPKPDLVIFLELDPEKAIDRSGYGEELYENVEFQRRVQRQFYALSESESGSEPGSEPGSEEESWVMIDASASVQDVHAQILAHVLAAQLRCAEYEIRLFT